MPNPLAIVRHRRLGPVAGAWRADGTRALRMLDVAMCAATTWILVGLYLDGYHHSHGKGVETFFTPWHAVLYSGLVAACVVLLAYSKRVGPLPPAYLASMFAVVTFGLAGVADLFWHLAFGFERSAQILVSPPHLLLFGSGVVIVSGPLRRHIAHPSGPSFVATWSATLTLAGLAFAWQYTSPFAILPTADAWNSYPKILAISGVLVWSLLIGCSVALVQGAGIATIGFRFLVVVVPAAATTTQTDNFFYVPVLAATGVVCELAAARWSAIPTAVLCSLAATTAWLFSLATMRVYLTTPVTMGCLVNSVGVAYMAAWVLAHAGAGRTEPFPTARAASDPSVTGQSAGIANLSAAQPLR